MNTRDVSPSAEIRSRLDHPIIDADGHMLEYQPAYLDFLKEVGGPGIVERFDKRVIDRMDQSPTMIHNWYSSTPKERAEKRIRRPPWWAVATRNTVDRVTSSIPRLLYERLDEFGLDFTVQYPTLGTTYLHIGDAELRRAACRAHNNFQASIFAEFSDRIAPVAVIPMHTPEEALAELDHAIGKLGMKAILMPSYVLRPRIDGQGVWYDTFCIDSDHDYDPVWAKCVALKVAPSFHSNNQGIGNRNSISNYVYNHIGHFASAGEAICKSAFLGGVTRRFPELRMVFLEGGVGWACNLYNSLIGHWKKRSKAGLDAYDPARLDTELFWKLHRDYGGKMVKGKLDDEDNRRRAMYLGHPSFSAVRVAGDPGATDDFAACGIESPEDIRDLFVPNFYFGCEADDPMTALAFDTRKNPYGARLSVVFGSDIGHWDVPEMREVSAEAYEMVEHGMISEADFRDFVFGNPVRLLTHMNPDFFKGTVIESHVKKVAR